MLVVSLIGEFIKCRAINVCTVDRIENLDKVRTFIHRKYGFIFKDKPNVSTKWAKSYPVDGSKEDISMFVEQLEHICGDGSH